MNCMQCPKCGSDSDVIDSRLEGDGRRRRRRCPACSERWSTLERHAGPVEVEDGIVKALDTAIAMLGKVREGIDAAVGDPP